METKIITVNSTINLVLHALILFTFLSIFYFFYITPLVKQTFKNELSNIVDNSLSDTIKNLKQNATFSVFLKNIPLDNISANYSKEDNAVTAINNGVQNVVITINVLIWISYIVIVILLKKRHNTPILYIILENICVFILIGIIEYLFFSYIASKYIPVEPSFMINYFIQSLLNKLE